MSKVPPPEQRDPTTSRPRFVGSRSEKSRFVRQFLAGLLRSIRKKRPWAAAEGDLSSWILFMHGLTGKTNGGDALEQKYDDAVVTSAVNFMNQILGPGMDTRQMENAARESQRLTEADLPKIVEAYRQGNVGAFHAQLSNSMSKVVDAWGIPPELFKGMGLSLDQFFKIGRAIRATVACVALYNDHPLLLISRATKGDRRAVLDLIKADKLFLHDRCCTGVIRSAELHDDRTFMDQLKRALAYEPRLHRRDAQHIYYYVLCLLERWGFVLPSLNELCSMLDPYAREYGSLAAFEKDFQRRRQDLATILAQAEQEVSIDS
jgi:hypothetical protein